MTRQSKIIGAYRPDVDGLRAIAVLSVLAFHAFPALAPGGFIGVDVFFVISGFLITGVIHDESARGRFTILSFYERRVRRIFPALLLVMFCTAAYGWQFFYPDELASLCKHMAAGGLFLSNYAYWLESGYFDKAAESKPLLHLWSLAVEEQFYLLWPLLVMALLRWRRSTLLASAACLALLSFIASCYLVNVDRAAAYFLPQSRFWEILVGAILAIWLRQSSVPLRQRASHLLFISGVVLIAAGLVFINKWRQFPGVWAVLPVLGAALIIASGSENVLSKWLLQNRLLVRVGLISYPLYLWHWPLIVLSDIEWTASEPYQRHLLALTLAFLLAELTYQLLEKPIKKAGNLAPLYLTLTMAVLVGFAALVVRAEGAPARLPNEVVNLRASHMADLSWVDVDAACADFYGLRPWMHEDQQIFCRANGDPSNATVAILGDSTANALYPGVVAMPKHQGEVVVNIGNGTCPPIWGVAGTAKWNQRCRDLNARVRQYILNTPSVKTVILSWASWDWERWSWPEPVGGGLDAKTGFVPAEAIATQLLDKTVRELRAKGKQVIVVFDGPSLPVRPELCLPRLSGIARPICDFTDAQIKQLHPYLPAWERIVAKVKQPGVCSASLSLTIRQNMGGYKPIGPDGKLWFRDAHHLSETGSRHMAPHLLAQCSTQQGGATASEGR